MIQKIPNLKEEDIENLENVLKHFAHLNGLGIYISGDVLNNNDYDAIEVVLTHNKNSKYKKPYNNNLEESSNRLMNILNPNLNTMSKQDKDLFYQTIFHKKITSMRQKGYIQDIKVHFKYEGSQPTSSFDFTAVDSKTRETKLKLSYTTDEKIKQSSDYVQI